MSETYKEGMINYPKHGTNHTEEHRPFTKRDRIRQDGKTSGEDASSAKAGNGSSDYEYNTIRSDAADQGAKLEN